jgi:type VI protein secretion system component VasF
LNGYTGSVSFSPDGLTEQVIDALLKEVDAVLADAPRPTSALLNGSAAERRRRRMAHRAMAAVVRALPACRGGSGPDGQEAA